jgi:hypothetical protein
MSLANSDHLSQHRKDGNDFKIIAAILLAGMALGQCMNAQSDTGCGQFEATNAKACFGAKGDLRSADRCSMTLGSGSLRCLGGPFVAGDVGKAVYVQSAGSSGGSLASSISAFVSASEVDVTSAAGSSVNNVTAVWATDDTAALQSAYKAVVAHGGALYLPPGNYLHHGLNWTGNTIKIYGDAYGSAQLTALDVTNPGKRNMRAQTVGVDLSGSGYNQVSDLVFFGGLDKFKDLAPKINILAGRSGSSGSDFANAHIFESDFFVAFGSYNVVLYAYEQSDFHNNQFESSGAVNNGTLYLSAANSPGFVSPYVNLVAPVSSMTKVNVSGGRTSFGGSGKLIVLDQGGSGSDYSVSIRDAYGLLGASGSTFLSDTGSASGYGLRHIVLDEINIETVPDCRNCRAVEINAPAWNWDIRNVQFYGETGMTVSPFTFHGGFLDGSAMIDSTGQAAGYVNPEFNAPSCAGSVLHLGEQQPTVNCTDYGFRGAVHGDTPGWIHGATVPNGSCTNGSLYSNTSGAKGSTLYVCVAGSWVDLK